MVPGTVLNHSWILLRVHPEPFKTVLEREKISYVFSNIYIIYNLYITFITTYNYITCNIYIFIFINSLSQ